MGEGLFAPSHLLLLAIVAAILFFGWKQLPDMSRSLGRSLRILKTEVKGMTEDDRARESAREADAAPVQARELPAAAPVVRPVAQPTATVRPAAPVTVQQQAAAPVQATVQQPTPAAAPRPRPTPRGSATAGAGQSPAPR